MNRCEYCDCWQPAEISEHYGNCTNDKVLRLTQSVNLVTSMDFGCILFIKKPLAINPCKYCNDNSSIRINAEESYVWVECVACKSRGAREHNEKWATQAWNRVHND